jgi:lysophospholipase L1-like esterase
MYGGNANSWQVKRHNEKMSVVTNGGAKVVFVGDSITHFWESHGREQLGKYFSEGDMKMLDLGISADRTEHVLWRLDEGRELDGYEAKCVLLMIGTNNAGHFPIEKEPPADTILGIREILRTIRAKQPKATIILHPIFPRGEKITDSMRIRNDKINRSMKALADGETVIWCDINDSFVDADGNLPSAIFPDLLHPAEEGYVRWAAKIKPYIEWAVSDRTTKAPKQLYSKYMEKADAMAK